MRRKLNLLTLFLALIIVPRSQASNRTQQTPYQAEYVVVCQNGNQITTEPYILYQGRIQFRLTPDSFAPAQTYQDVLIAALNRFATYSAERSQFIWQQASARLENDWKNARFIPTVEIVPQAGETPPTASTPGCEVKKLFAATPDSTDQLIFDGTLWNSLSETGKAAVVVAHALQVIGPHLNYYDPRSHFLPDRGEITRQEYVATLFSTQLSGWSDQTWFSKLERFGFNSTIFKGISLNVYGATFYSDSGKLKSDWINEDYFSWIKDEQVELKGTIGFYPNGVIQELTPKSSKDFRYPTPSGEVTLDPGCDAEFSDQGTLIMGCGSITLENDFHSIKNSGTLSFYPSGRLKTASTVYQGLVRLSGRIVSVNTELGPLSYDESGNLQEATLATPTVLRTAGTEFRLAKGPITLYANHNLRSAVLADNIQTKDCKSQLKSFTAGSVIQFNESEIPCEDISP